MPVVKGPGCAMSVDRLTMRGPFASATARMRAFARDERGVTAIEFGVLALPFFTVIFAILQTAIMFLTSQVLDSALEDASRKVRTGEASGYTIAQFRTLVCDSTYSLIDCSQIQLRSEVISGFANIVTTVPQSCNLATCTWTSGWQNYDSGSTGVCRQVVQVSAYYRYPLIVVLPYFNLKNQPDNYRLLGATRVFRNEPYNC
jgi:Flp pilus assembly protein TadG